jgi:methionine-rich copper-binding protein CopC
MRATVRLLSALALTTLGLALTGVAPAHAHARLVSSTPAQDAILDALPDQVSFVFSEPMDPSAYVVVTAPDGTALTTGEPVVDEYTITQDIRGAGEGTYLMAVKAVSRDGHPITGRVEFAVGAPSVRSETPLAGPLSDPAATSGATSASSEAVPAGRRGHDDWVWWVGPIFMTGGLAMWAFGRRSPT